MRAGFQVSCIRDSKRSAMRKLIVAVGGIHLDLTVHLPQSLIGCLGDDPCTFKLLPTRDEVAAFIAVHRGIPQEILL